jgi:hypothetical protein
VVTVEAPFLVTFSLWLQAKADAAKARARGAGIRYRAFFNRAWSVGLGVPMVGAMMATTGTFLMSLRRRDRTEAGFTTPEIIIATAVGVAIITTAGLLIYNAVTSRSNTVATEIKKTGHP